MKATVALEVLHQGSTGITMPVGLLPQFSQLPASADGERARHQLQLQHPHQRLHPPLDGGRGDNNIVVHPAIEALEAFLCSPDVFYAPLAYVGKRSLAEEFAQFCGGFDAFEQWEDVKFTPDLYGESLGRRGVRAEKGRKRFVFFNSLFPH